MGQELPEGRPFVFLVVISHYLVKRAMTVEAWVMLVGIRHVVSFGRGANVMFPQMPDHSRGVPMFPMVETLPALFRAVSMIRHSPLCWRSCVPVLVPLTINLGTS